MNTQKIYRGSDVVDIRSDPVDIYVRRIGKELSWNLRMLIIYQLILVKDYTSLHIHIIFIVP